METNPQESKNDGQHKRNTRRKEMRMLRDERFEYESIMNGILKSNDCFNYKAPCTFIKPPEDFENHTPCEDSKKW